MILTIWSFLLVRQLFAWLLILGTTNRRSTSRDQYHDRAREYEDRTEHDSSFLLVLPPRPAIVCPLATGTTNRRITSQVRGSLPPQHAPNAILHTRHDKTILPPRRDNNDDGNDDRGCCCCRFDVTASFCVLLLYHTIHCYDVTITNSTNSSNNTNKHTCKK